MGPTTEVTGRDRDVLTRQRAADLVRALAGVLTAAGHQVTLEEAGLSTGTGPVIRGVNGQTVNARADLERHARGGYSVRVYYTGRLRFHYWDAENRTVSLPEPKAGFDLAKLLERLVAVAREGAARRAATERREERLLHHRRLTEELATEFKLGRLGAKVRVSGTADGISIELRSLEPETARQVLALLRDGGVAVDLDLLKGGS